MNKNKPITKSKKKPVEASSFKNKLLGVLGLQREEDIHGVSLQMQSVAESIARLTELVESIDERVLLLDSRVSHLEVHISARITKSEQAITDSWDDTAQEIYMHNENAAIANQKWYEGWNRKVDKLLKKIVDPVLSSDVSVGPTAPPAQTFSNMEVSVVALTTSVENLAEVVSKLDVRMGKLEKSVSKLAVEQAKHARKMKNY